MKMNFLIGLLTFNAVLTSALFYGAYRDIRYNEMEGRYWACRGELNKEASLASKAQRGLAFYRRQVKLGQLVERDLASAAPIGGAYVGPDANVGLGGVRKAE